jgi:tetratricopeptide (TPR) repeat protein
MQVAVYNSYNNLGALLLAQGRAEEAVRVLDDGLRVQPDHSALLRNRGRAAAALGDDDGAIRYYEMGLQKDPGSVELHRLAAEWYERHGRTADAVRHWEIVAGSPAEEEARLGSEALQRLRGD